MADNSLADSSIGSQFTLHPAAPAFLSSRGSEQTVTTPGATTTSSSEPLQPSPGQPLAAAHPGPSTLPGPVRSTGGADAQLDRLLQAHDQAEPNGSLQAHDQAEPYGPLRDRSRERDRSAARAERYAIHTPGTVSPAVTPPLRRPSPRANPVTPVSSNEQITELKSQVVELNRQLRAANRHALEYEQAVEQQATAAVAYTQQQAAVALAQAHSEHAAAMIQFREWGGGAKEEVD